LRQVARAKIEARREVNIEGSPVRFERGCIWFVKRGLPVTGSDCSRIANMRPAIAAPSEGVKGRGVQALIAASALVTISSRMPAFAGRT